MSYGLQIFNAQGNPIMDTDERFTRVYGTYNNITIQGTRTTTNDTKYVQMSTFSNSVSVNLPSTIQNWAPMIVSATSVWTGSNTLVQVNANTTRMVDGISYAVHVNAFAGKVNYLNISESTALVLTGGQAMQEDGNGAGLPPTATDLSPRVSAEAVPGSSPSVKLYYTYLANISHKDIVRVYASERRATISFIIVGY